VNLADALRHARARGDPAIVPYLMVDRDRTAALVPTVTAFRRAGATALELGFPFSDPVADGPVLEGAAGRSLAHGTRWTDLLGACRAARGILPTAVMTYANPVWQRGLPTALAELATAGASGLIVPDLSLEDSGPWRRAARAAGVSLVLLAAPGEPPERLDRIARTSRGFLYLVGHYGTTGAAAAGASIDLAPLIRRARHAARRLPILVGFGIRDRPSVLAALRQGADGVVIATALEERFRRGDSPAGAGRWLRSVTGKVQGPTGGAR